MLHPMTKEELFSLKLSNRPITVVPGAMSPEFVQSLLDLGVLKPTDKPRAYVVTHRIVLLSPDKKYVERILTENRSLYYNPLLGLVPPRQRIWWQVKCVIRSIWKILCLR